MREVLRNADSALVAMYQSLLEDAGIQCFTYNWTTQQALMRGLLVAFFPLPIFYPTLCVVNDADYEEAMEILKTPAVSGEEWSCPACREAVPGNFTACWKCETARAGPGQVV
jgi:hypothetical protein